LKIPKFQRFKISTTLAKEINRVIEKLPNVPEVDYMDDEGVVEVSVVKGVINIKIDITAHDNVG
jgi:hypothetical protein